MTQPSSSDSSSRAGRARVGLRLEIEEVPGRWRMEEESVPESTLHDAIIELLKLILKHWVRREGRAAYVAANLACRWDESDARVGIDPDLALLEPAPSGAGKLSSLRIWEKGHEPPPVAVEVVSPNTADKDYFEGPARCARLGVRELWIFDPLLEGPAGTGGPFILQIWRLSSEGGDMTRVYAGDGPAYSEELSAWLVVTDAGERLRLAEDAEGEALWPTEAEAEAQLRKAAERRAESAEAEVARLRKLLDDQG